MGRRNESLLLFPELAKTWQEVGKSKRAAGLGNLAASLSFRGLTGLLNAP
jgi:hypothetical protein